MIKILIPESKGRNKTNVRGFWYSQDNKKVYYDYLSSQNYKDDNPAGLFNHVDNLKSFYNQECIFYSQDNKGFIYYNRDRIEGLINRIYSEVKPENLRAEIKEALKVYGGVTIYRIGNQYFKEIFYK
jgi:hypothetical protein